MYLLILIYYSHKAGNTHNKEANQDIQKSALDLKHPTAISNDNVRNGKRKLKKKKDKTKDKARKKPKLDKSV